MKFIGLAAVIFSGIGLMPPRTLTVDEWIMQQMPVSIAALEQNITPSDGTPGSMIASPSQSSPNYYFHWVRDSALAYLTVFHLYESGSSRQQWKQNLLNFAAFSAHIQTTADSLGEPKFYVNGAPYTGAWCRPQNDGPALRAITLMQFAKSLIAGGEQPLAQTLLPVINNDLNFVMGAWNQTGCDLWEEVAGQHFYTMMVQRRALLQAAQMAEFLGQDASQLTGIAAQLATAILGHWNESAGYFVATLNQTGGITYKASNLDASIILGVIHGHTDDGFLPYTDPRVLSTAQALISVFASKFAINQLAGVPGVAVGRYPEDLYAGSNFNGGNPWVLLTAAMSRFYYLAYLEAKNKGDVNAGTYLTEAEALMQRLQYHAPDDGIWAEQMDRNTGFMTSAPDLTWSHTEVLEAFSARKRVLGN